MKLKTLLLGTATAFVVAGGAQAADLAVAESVEYVKVCDAYGAGYFYVPGSDVCLNIGAYGLMVADFFSSPQNLNFGVGVSGSDLVRTSDYQASWDMYWEDQISVTARWMTDWGAATVLVAIRNHHDADSALGASIPGSLNSDASGGIGYLDTGYIKIGGLLAGYNSSTFDGGMFHGLNGFESPFDHDIHQNQLQWSTTLGGIGAFFAVEDPRDQHGGSAYYTGDFPDLVAALAGNLGGFAWRWSVGATDTNYGTGWGTEFDIGWHTGHGIEGGTGVSLQGAVGNEAGATYAIGAAPNGGGGTPWHATFQGGIGWTNTFTSLLGVSYANTNGGNTLEVSAEGDWLLAKGVEAGLSVGYVDPENGSSATVVDARIKAWF